MPFFLENDVKMKKNAEYAFMYILDLSDVDFLDDSSTESLLLSGDEYNQDFDSTNFEESQDEDDTLNEIVRCICEMDEENGFMIQVTCLPFSTEWVSSGAQHICWGICAFSFSSPSFWRWRLLPVVMIGRLLLQMK